jgi:hypothetical protein
METELTAMAEQDVRPAGLVWFTRVARVSFAILLLGSAWQLSEGLAQAPLSPPPIEERQPVAAATDAQRLRKGISDMETARRELERTLTLLEQTNILPAATRTEAEPGLARI